MTGTLQAPPSADALAGASRSRPPLPRVPGGWGLALTLLIVVTRLPALTHPRMIDDERVYSVVAIEMLEGGRPYVDAVVGSPPLLLWTYAGILGIVGRYNVLGLHLAALLWVLLTMLGLYATARTLFSRRVGVAAALLYGVYQPWLFYHNLAFNGEVLMNLPIAWAVFLTLRRGGSSLRLELLAAGSLLCLAFLLKQPAAIAALPLGLYLLLPGYRSSRGLERRHVLLHASWLTVGYFGTLGLAALVLHSQGLLSEAYYWTIVDHAVPFIQWSHGLVMSLAFVAFSWPLVGGALISLCELRASDAGLWQGRRPEVVALTLLLLASLLGTVAGGRFYHHYFIQLVPPLALLAAPVWVHLLTNTGIETSRWFSRPVVLPWLVVSVVVSLISHTVGLASRREVSDVGRYIRAHSRPEDRMFVWGLAAVHYLDAQRRPASRYVITSPLTGHIFGWPRNTPTPDTRERIVPGAWEIFEREITLRPPKFIVDVEVVRRPWPQYPIERYPFLRDLLERRYRLVERASAGWIYERIGCSTATACRGRDSSRDSTTPGGRNRLSVALPSVSGHIGAGLDVIPEGSRNAQRVFTPCERPTA